MEHIVPGIKIRRLLITLIAVFQNFLAAKRSDFEKFGISNVQDFVFLELAKKYAYFQTRTYSSWTHAKWKKSHNLQR